MCLSPSLGALLDAQQLEEELETAIWSDAIADRALDINLHVLCSLCVSSSPSNPSLGGETALLGDKALDINLHVLCSLCMPQPLKP